MTQPSAARLAVRQNASAILDDLRTFAAIPSISTLSEHRPDIVRASEWLADKMKNQVRLNNVQILPTGGAPIVYGEWLENPSQLTVLVYGHYDVQPVDPLNEWRTPPFEPTQVGDNLHARGISDMKGQVWSFLSALGALQANGGIPVNVKVLVEGEEEIGSPHLAKFIAAHKDLLKADFSLNADMGIVDPNTPSLVYGLRGLAYFELWVHGAKSDLHSGLFGGVVHNPAQVLAELIAGMHDAQGRVTLPGFYEKVRTLAEDERAELARMPISEEQLLRTAANPPQFYGEAGYTSFERMGARPTLEINGLYSGFIGEGSKTVLPAKAMAKISMRLVPYQKGADIRPMLEAYLQANAPASVHWQLIEHVHSDPVLTSRDSAPVQAAISALESVFSMHPIFRLEGGSVPVVSVMQDVLGIDSVMMGFALPDDAVHAPNEKLHVPTFLRGIEVFIEFFQNIRK
ncbi:MAG TPA: dipeptidase [Anaerolineales bacterium]|nr:dipeptidase [Anaerolineales bacterium]